MKFLPFFGINSNKTEGTVEHNELQTKENLSWQDVIVSYRPIW